MTARSAITAPTDRTVTEASARARRPTRNSKVRPRNYSTSTSSRSVRSRFDLLLQRNTEMICHRPFPPGDVVINGGVQNQRFTIFSLDYHCGGTASIQAHGVVRTEIFQ